MSDDALIEAMADEIAWAIGEPLHSRSPGIMLAAQRALAAIRKTHAVVSREALQDIDAIARTSIGPGYSAILGHTRAMLSAGENHDGK